MHRQDFLTHVARKLGRTAPPTTPPLRQICGAPEYWTHRQATVTERIERFRTALESIGGVVEIYQNLTDLKLGLKHRLSSLGARQIGMWGGTTLCEFELDDILQPYTVLKWGEDSMEAFEQTDIGLTGCFYAIADTGTLVMRSNIHQGRSVHVLPSLHLALVKTSQLRLRLGEVLDELSAHRQEMPSSVHFVSGPSRSSDIENDQSIGVHGPAGVYVMLLNA